MGHAIHFLERLSRISEDHIGSALSLYYSSERTRDVISLALNDAPPPDAALSELRVACALDDSPTPPYLIANRQGRMITCLAPGMIPYGLPVIPAADLFRACNHFDDFKDRERHLLNLKGSVKNIFKPLAHQTWALPRSTFRALSFFSPWLELNFFSTSISIAVSLSDQRDRLVRLVRRAQSSRQRATISSPNARSSMSPRHAHRYDDALREYWEQIWAHNHLLLLSVGENPSGVSKILASVPQSDSPQSPYIVGWSSVRQGLLPLTLRGAWASAQLGGEFIEGAARSISTHCSPLGTLNHLLPLGILAIRDPSLRPDALRLLSDAINNPPNFSPPDSDLYIAYARLVHTVASLSPTEHDSLSSTCASKGRLWYTSLFNTKRKIPLPTTLPSPEDLPTDIALLFSSFIPSDTIVPNRGDYLNLPFFLPWLAQAQAQDLFMPDDYAPLLKVWHPELCADMLLSHAIGYGDHQRATQPTAAKPSRNDHCPCGSGQKYKRCCIHKSST